jgi:hypothetical protein
MSLNNMKSKIRIYLDYIPLVILLASAALLIWSVVNDGIVLNWKHYIGLVVLPVCVVLFMARHLYGVLFLGVMLIAGLIGLLSYSIGITTTSFGLGDPDDGITLVRFQPIFLLWLVIYFVVSGRHIVGIGTKKYWEEVKARQR